MPQLPDRQRSGFLQTEVPRQTGPITANGAQYDALSKLGNTIGNIALDLQDKRTKAEEQQFLINKDTEDLLETKKFVQENRLKTGGVGHTQAVEDFVQQRLETNMEDAPTENAKMRYEQSARNMFTREAINASSFEQERRVIKTDSDMTQNWQAYARVQQDTPNPVEAQERMQKLGEAYTGYVGNQYDQQTADAKYLEAKNGITKGVLDGLYNNGKYRDGLALLKSDKDGIETEFAKSLTPKEKDYYRDQIMSKMAKDKEMSGMSLANEVSDISARGLIKLDVPDSSYANILSKLTTARNAGIIDKNKYSDMRDNVLSTQKVTQKLSGMKNSSISELRESKKTTDAMLRELVPPGQDPHTYNAKLKLQLEHKYSEAVDEVIKKRETDGMESSFGFDKRIAEKHRMGQSFDEAGYAASREAIALSKKAQAALGITSDKIRVTTDGEIGVMAEAFRTAGNSERLAKIFTEYENHFGEDTRKAMLEATSDPKNGVPKEYIALANISSVTDRKDFLKNLKDVESIDLKFKNSGISDTELDRHVAKALEPLTMSLGGVPENFKTGFIDAAKLQMKSILNAKNDTDKAGKEITRMFFDNNFHSISGPSGGIIAPRIPENKPVIIGAFLQEYTLKDQTKNYSSGLVQENKKLLDSLGVVTPKDYIENFKKISPTFTDKSAEESYQKELSLRGKWKTNRDHSGVEFVFEVTPGSFAPVRDGNDKPIGRSFKELSDTNDPKILNNIRSPLKKFGDLFGL